MNSRDEIEEIERDSEYQDKKPETQDWKELDDAQRYRDIKGEY